MTEEFKIGEKPDLASEEWRPLAGDEFKMIREDNIDNQNRLTVSLPKGGRKVTIPPFDSATLKELVESKIMLREEFFGLRLEKMTKKKNNKEDVQRTALLVGVGAVVAVMIEPTSMAQSPSPQEGTVNRLGSVFHGRTIKVADKILSALGQSITRYNQVTNLAQLGGITSLYLSGLRLTSLQAGDFEGLTNLQTLNLSNNDLTSLPAGIFDERANPENPDTAVNPPSSFQWDNWHRAVVCEGTTHNSIEERRSIDTTTRPTHDLSGMAGSTAATYEFVVNVPQTDQFSPTLLSDGVWGLKFHQVHHTETPPERVNQLGITKWRVEDYFFASISGQSLASPYGRDAHIVYTYDGSNTEVFVDGQKVGSLSGQGHIFTHAASELGWSSVFPDSVVNLKGQILAFASYRSVLSNEEIQSHYNAAFSSGTFGELVNLENLDLSVNLLTELPDRIFDKLIDLKELHLTWNHLTSESAPPD